MIFRLIIYFQIFVDISLLGLVIFTYLVVRKRTMKIPDRIKAFLPLFPGSIVYLTNDPDKVEWEVVEYHSISRGPMGQFHPSLSYMFMRTTKDGNPDYSYFRRDSVTLVKW